MPSHFHFWLPVCKIACKQLGAYSETYRNTPRKCRNVGFGAVWETVGLQQSVMAASVVIFSLICAAAEGNLTQDQLAWLGNNQLNRPCAPSLLLCLWLWVTHYTINGRRFLNPLFFWASLEVFSLGSFTSALRRESTKQLKFRTLQNIEDFTLFIIVAMKGQ